MKRTLSALGAVLLLAVSAFSQILGGNIQSNYNNWVLTSTSAVAATSGQVMSFQPSSCLVSVGSKAMFPFSTKASVTVNDGAKTETVTPSAVTYTSSTCSITATFGQEHAAGVTVQSGTSGLQEASNDAAVNGYVFKNPVGGLDVYKQLTSATPATTRAFIGEITTNNASMDLSGEKSIVGVRALATVPSGTTVSGTQGFIEGAQGKLVVAGVLNGSEWAFGTFGQLDVSAATLTAGSYLAPLAGDFGATGPSVTCTFCYLLSLTNTTATTLGSAVNIYSKASTAFAFNSNGSAMLDASSTASGSVIGHILVTINGTAGVIRVYNGS